MNLEEEIDAVPLNIKPGGGYGGGGGGGSSGVSRTGAWLLEVLEKHNVTCATAELLVSELEKCVGFLMEERTLGGPAAALRLEIVVKFIRTVRRR
jgi:hypothetical protein